MRPTFLFPIAYALTMTPHEAAHALAAHLLGVRVTLYSMWVNPIGQPANSGDDAIIAAAGPLFSLALGAVCWLGYRRLCGRPVGLLVLLGCFVSTAAFLAPVAAAPFGGDANRALVLLGVPRSAQIAISITGWICLMGFMAAMGRELQRWAPKGASLASRFLCTIALPAVIGTALVLLLYWPLPSVLVGSTLSGIVFWVFALPGAAVKVDPNVPTGFPLRWLDFVWAGAAVLLVRSLMNGVTLG